MAFVGTDNIIQKKVLSATNMVTTNPGTSFQEVSDAFRLTITPKFSDSMIFLEYMIPLNQTITLDHLTKPMAPGGGFEPPRSTKQ